MAALQLASLAFLLVGGGAIGIEPAISATGPFWTLVGLVVFPFFWALPQAVITAELSTAYDSNGGYVIWSQKAFGAMGSWFMGFNALLANGCSLSLYPVLFVDYVTQIIPLSPIGRIRTIWLLVCFVVFLNLQGIDILAKLSLMFSFLIVLPYAAEFLYVSFAGKLHYGVWFRSYTPLNWSMLLHVLAWNYSGWDRLSCLAGEIHDPQGTFPLAIVIAIVMVTMNYVLPVAVAVCIDQDFSAYKGGHFVDVARQIGPIFPAIVLISAVTGIVGSFNATLATNARALWRIAEYRMLPHWLTKVNRSNSPYMAVVAHGVFAALLAPFPFHELIGYTNVLFILTVLFEVVCFLYLKRFEPQVVRPFAVPGRFPGAVLFSFPLTVTAVVVLLLSSYSTLLFAGVWNVILLIGFRVWLRYSEPLQHHLISNATEKFEAASIP